MTGKIRVTIDKDYYFPTIETLSVSKYIKVYEALKNEERDNKIISELLECSETLIEELDYWDYRKLVVLAENLLSSPSSSLDYNITFLPLSSYPFGQFSDWIQACQRYNFDARAIPYTIAYLRPSTSFNLRNTEYLEWANNLPACVGIYYFNKMIAELEELNKKFRNLKTEDPTDIEIKAGIEHLAKYGGYLTIHSLANGDVTKVNEIAKMRTAEVFTWLRADKDVNTYREEIQILKGLKKRE